MEKKLKKIPGAIEKTRRDAKKAKAEFSSTRSMYGIKIDKHLQITKKFPEKVSGGKLRIPSFEEAGVSFLDDGFEIYARFKR